MADNDHDLDDFDLDDELDIPDFDDAGLGGPSAKDRKPVERVAGGFLEGVKNTSMDKSFQRRLIGNSLPEGYGKAFDDVDDAISMGQDLYDTAASTLRPYQKTVKKIGRRVTEKADKFLPESLSNKLKEMTEPDNDRAEEVDYKEAEISSNLAEIFGAQAESDAEQKAEDETRQNVRDVVDEKRYSTEIDVLKTIRSGIDRMVSYQDRVTAGYQRKSLELQFRQLFVARDQYTLLEAHVKENKLQLDAIGKNTSLPEFVKMRGNEAMRQMLRERAYAGAMDKVRDRSKDFVSGLRDKAMTKVKGFTQSVGEGIQGIGDAMEMAEGAGVDIDPLDMGGQMASGALMDEGASRYGRTLGKYLSKIPGVDRMGDRLEYYSDNKEEVVRGFLNDIAKKGNDGLGDDFDLLSDDEQAARLRDLEGRTAIEKMRDTIDRGTGGMQSAMARMALDFIGPEGSADQRFSQSSTNLATEISPYTSMADRSITEIIPGLLTNILHETEMIRTGRDDIDRRVYDADARTFRREGDVQNDLMDTVMSESSREGVREDIDRIIDEIDSSEILSDEGRSGFRRQLLDDLAAGKGFRVEKYADANKLTSVNDFDTADEISQLVNATFLDDEGQFRRDDDVSQNIRNTASKRYKSASGSIPNYQEAVANIYATYGPETLRKMGLLVDEGRGNNSLDTERFLDSVAYGTSLDERSIQAMPDFRVREDPPTYRDTGLDNIVPQPQTSTHTTVQSPVDTSVMEESLSVMQSMLGQFVDVPRGQTIEEGFKNVLTAIGRLDTTEHFEINNDWLKKIYELLLGCCGPGGGPDGGPGGPGPGGDGRGSPDDGERQWRRRVPNPEKFLTPASRFGTSLIGGVKERYESSGTRGFVDRTKDRTKQKIDKVKEDPRLKGLVDTSRDVVKTTRQRAEGAVDTVRDLTTDDVKNAVITGADRIQSADPRAVISQSRDVVQGVVDKGTSYGSRVSKRLTDNPTYAKVQDKFSEVGSAVSEGTRDLRDRLPEDLTFGMADKIDIESITSRLNRDELEDVIRSLGERGSDVVNNIDLRRLKDLDTDDLKTVVNTSINKIQSVDYRDTISKGKAVLSDATSTAMDYGSRTKDAVVSDPRYQEAKDTVSRIGGKAAQRGREFRDKLPEDLTFGLGDKVDPEGLEKIFGFFNTVSERAGVRDMDIKELGEGAMSSVSRFGKNIAERGQNIKSALPEMTSFKPAVGTNVVSMADHRLENQPMAQSGQSRGLLPAAVGDSVRSAGTSIRGRFDRTRDSMTGGLDAIRDRLDDKDFDLTQYFGEDAVNDPKLALSALQSMTKEALSELEALNVGGKVKSLTDDVVGSTKGVLSALANKVKGTSVSETDEATNIEPSQTSTESTFGRNEFWDRAWEMLTNLKGHMDVKTHQLVEAMSLIQGDGTGSGGSLRDTLKKASGKVASGVGGIASFYGNTFKGGGKLLAGAGRGAGGILSGLGQNIGSRFRRKPKADESTDNAIVDIYLEGQDEPVMLARDLRQGLYFDRETLETVERLEDITGAVVNNDNNIVVTTDDVAENRLYTLAGKSSGPGLLSRAAKGYANYATAPMRMVFSATRRAGQFLIDRAKEPQDIYVKGEDSPRLLAIVMKNGGYVSKASQSTIESPKDIDGDVVDLQGRTVLTEAELRDPGIVDARGKKIRSVAGGVGSVAGKAMDMLGGYYRGVWNAGKGMVKGIGNVLGFGEGEGGSGGGGLFSSGKKQVEWLEKIYTLLDDRIEVPDGVRTGSWRDLMSDEDDEEDGDSSTTANKGESKKSAGLDLAALLGGALSKLNPFGEGGIGVDADIPLGGDREGRRERRDRKRNRRNNRPRKGKGGWASKLWRGAKSLGRGAMNVGKFALPAAATALTSVGTALGTAAATVGSVLASPVVLTGAAIAAVGVGAYLLYKNFANDPDGPLHEFRLKQYGLDPDAGDPVARISALETKLEEEVNLANGQPTINQSVDPKELLEICGVDEEDPDAVRSWASWFQLRFKPVFLTHIAVLNSMASDVKIADVDDDLDEKLKSTYLKRVHFKEGSDAPYRATDYVPFDDLDPMIGPAGVKSEYEKQMAELSKKHPPKERESEENNAPKTPPKKDSDALRAGVDRRSQHSPTAKEIGRLPRTVFASLSKTPEGRAALTRRRQQMKSGEANDYDEPAMTEADVLARYGADAESKSSQVDTTDSKDPEKAESTQERTKNRQVVPKVKPTNRRTMVDSMQGNDDASEDDRRIDEKRQREQRVSIQTETQSAKNATALNSAVNRMVSILSDSHNVQSNINKTLTEMNKMLQKRHASDTSPNVGGRSETPDADARYGGGSGQSNRPESRSVPYPTNKY